MAHLDEIIGGSFSSHHLKFLTESNRIKVVAKEITSYNHGNNNVGLLVFCQIFLSPQVK